MDVRTAAIRGGVVYRLAAALAVVVLAAFPVGPAWAHSKLLKASPAPGAKLTAAPKVVRAWFTVSAGEELDAERSTISVWNAAGKRVDDGKGGVDLADLDRRSMIVRLKPLAAGTYTVKWKAVSDPDGAVAQGKFTFSIVKKP
ncbi:MAG: copper resistance CopC family protein [bacterium]